MYRCIHSWITLLKFICLKTLFIYPFHDKFELPTSPTQNMQDLSSVQISP